MTNQSISPSREQRSGQTRMALRELARKGAGLVARVESQPAMFNVARAMTAKVNQVTGAPMELYKRKVVIYRPARAACQQGKALLNTWKIHPGEQQKWENPLMGWTSTGDASAHQFNSTMYFDSKEAAMAFCDKHGWEFEVQEPQLMGKGASTIPGAGKAGVRPKSYGDNFSSARKGFPIWPHPGFGAEAKN